MTSLAGRTALVTGSAHNLGRTIAQELARTGARVVTHARTAADARATAEHVTECTGAEAIPLAFDLGDVAAIEAGFDELDALGVVVDALVLNAAHLGLSHEETLLQDPSFFDDVLAVNVVAAYRCSLFAARRLVQEAKGGAFVLVSSLAGERAIHGRLAYNTSKAAVDGLVRSLALELAPHLIRVNGIAPGYVHSDRWGELDGSEVSTRRGLIPSGLETSQEEIARLTAFLLSDAAPSLTGERIVIDGGLSAQQSPRWAYSAPSNRPPSRSSVLCRLDLPDRAASPGSTAEHPG